MPNWCDNRLTVFGPQEDLRVFRRKAVGHNPWNPPSPDREPNQLNFHSLVPIPIEVLKAGYNPTGYNWEYKHWGVKHGASDVDFSTDSDETYPPRLAYWFRTPWSPPLAFLATVSRQWPRMRFFLDYSEEMIGFRGLAMSRGEKFENQYMSLW